MIVRCKKLLTYSMARVSLLVVFRSVSRSSLWNRMLFRMIWMLSTAYSFGKSFEKLEKWVGVLGGVQ